MASKHAGLSAKEKSDRVGRLRARIVKHGDGESAWNKLFPKPDREQAARAMVKEFEDEYSLGNYNEYIPKKYQPKKPAKRR